MLQRLRARTEWKFFSVLPRLIDRSRRCGGCCSSCAACCRRCSPSRWVLLVGAVQPGDSLATTPLIIVGVVFVLLQILTPIHQAVSANLGDRTAAWLYDRLTEACVRPPGMGHLEDPKLTGDLVVARDFDLGMTGPPLSISMDFIASDGLVETAQRPVVRASCSRRTRGGRRSLLGGAWLSTHWLLRESAVWRDRNTAEVRARAARCRLCLPPRRRSSRRPRKLRLVRPRRLDDRAVRRAPHPACTSCNTKRHGFARSRCCGVCCSSLGANLARLLVARRRRPRISRSIWPVPWCLAQSAVGVSMIAFGGLNWVLDGAAAPVVAVLQARVGDGAGRCDSIRHASGDRSARSRDPLSRSSRSRTRAARRCSITST